MTGRPVSRGDRCPEPHRAMATARGVRRRACAVAGRRGRACGTAMTSVAMTSRTATGRGIVATAAMAAMTTATWAAGIGRLTTMTTAPGRLAIASAIAAASPSPTMCQRDRGMQRLVLAQCERRRGQCRSSEECNDNPIGPTYSHHGAHSCLSQNRCGSSPSTSQGENGGNLAPHDLARRVTQCLAALSSPSRSAPDAGSRAWSGPGAIHPRHHGAEAAQVDQ